MHEHRQQRQRTAESPVPLMLMLVLVVGTMLPALIGGVVLRSWVEQALPNNRRPFWICVALGGLGLAVCYVLRESYAPVLNTVLNLLRNQHWNNLLPNVLHLWLLTLPSAPLVAGALSLLQPHTVADRIQQRESSAQQGMLRQQRAVMRHIAKVPDQVHGNLVLGVSTGDKHPWRQGTWLCYPAEELAQHAIVVGASGSGKTETILRLASLAATVYRWQVIFIDAKGDRDTAARFLGAMEAAHVSNVPFFPVRRLDGWQGDARALLNRLLAIQTFSEPYYADVTALVLRLAIFTPDGPPRNSSELLARLNLAALHRLYPDKQSKEPLTRLKAEDVNGVYRRYAAFFGTLDGAVDGRWSFDDVDAAYLLIDGTALKHEAESLGHFLVEDIAHYVTARKPRNQQVLIIIDEFSALRLAGGATGLFERIRAFGAAVVISAQSYAGLGSDAERLLGAATTCVVHACNDPERLTHLAGGQFKVDYSLHTAYQGTRPHETARPGITPLVDPDLVRRLDKGECYVIAHGHATWSKIAKLNLSPAIGARWLASGGWLTLLRRSDDDSMANVTGGSGNGTTGSKVFTSDAPVTNEAIQRDDTDVMLSASPREGTRKF